MYGDQGLNAAEIERFGTGIKINLEDLTPDLLSDAIAKVLADYEGFKQNLVNLNARLFDRINSPLEEAMWWLEYLVRNPDYENDYQLKKLPLFQYLMLDIAALLALEITLSCVGLFLCFKFCFRRSKAKMD